MVAAIEGMASVPVASAALSTAGVEPQQTTVLATLRLLHLQVALVVGAAEATASVPMANAALSMGGAGHPRSTALATLHLLPLLHHLLHHQAAHAVAAIKVMASVPMTSAALSMAGVEPRQTTVLVTLLLLLHRDPNAVVVAGIMGIAVRTTGATKASQTAKFTALELGLVRLAKLRTVAVIVATRVFGMRWRLMVLAHTPAEQGSLGCRAP